MVSMAVMGLLISILLPSLLSAHESARRVRCSSNVRQIGLALQMYAYENGDRLPSSVFDDDTGTRPAGSGAQDMIFLRVDEDVHEDLRRPTWDALGFLYQLDYLNHPGVFYCPSHHGEHDLDRYVDHFAAPGRSIASNYHYRMPDKPFLAEVHPSTALVADAMRTRSDYNHVVGNNLLKADLSVLWYNDIGGRIYDMLPEQPGQSGGHVQVSAAWRWLDEMQPTSDGPSTPPDGDGDGDGDGGGDGPDGPSISPPNIPSVP